MRGRDAFERNKVITDPSDRWTRWRSIRRAFGTRVLAGPAPPPFVSGESEYCLTENRKERKETAPLQGDGPLYRDLVFCRDYRIPGRNCLLSPSCIQTRSLRGKRNSNLSKSCHST